MMKLAMPLLLAVAATLLGGCVIKHDGSDNQVSKVETNSRLALEQCGKGNIQEVNKEGFVCKK